MPVLKLRLEIAKNLMIKRLLILGLFAIFLFAGLQNYSVARASSDLGPRVSRLESELLNLRTQIYRLESQISSASRSSPQRSAPLPPAAAPEEPRLYRPISPTDPMFDRLATLVIELKQQVSQLENRVSALEAAHP